MELPNDPRKGLALAEYYLDLHITTELETELDCFFDRFDVFCQEISGVAIGTKTSLAQFPNDTSATFLTLRAERLYENAKYARDYICMFRGVVKELHHESMKTEATRAVPDISEQQRKLAKTIAPNEPSEDPRVFVACIKEAIERGIETGDTGALREALAHTDTLMDELREKT